jgi:hypothetical protein
LGYEPSLDAATLAGGGEGARAAFVQGVQTAYLVMSGFLVLAILLSSFKGEGLVEEPEAGPNQQIPSTA